MEKINMRTIGDIEISIMDNDIELMKKLLKNNPEYINYCDDEIGTFMHVAASNGNIEAMKYLISLGIDINKCAGGFDANALVSAIANGHYEVAKYLIDSGSKIDISTSLRNPLLAAIDSNKSDCVKLILDKGIDVNKIYLKESGEALNAFNYAETYASQEIIDLIKDAIRKSNGKLDEDTKVEDKLINHIEKYLGNIDESISQLLSNCGVNFNINIIRESKERDYITLVTSGMSDVSMGYSERDNEEKYAELIIKLPTYWKLTEKDFKEERYVWPVKLISKLVYIAHSFSGFISEKVIIPNGIPGDAPLPYHVDTWLSSAMICKSEDIPPLKYNDDKIVDFFTIVPICDEEEDEAKKIGSNKFMETLPLKDVVDEKRGYED